jgi:hypothetical protein
VAQWFPEVNKGFLLRGNLPQNHHFSQGCFTQTVVVFGQSRDAFISTIRDVFDQRRTVCTSRMKDVSNHLRGVFTSKTPLG